MRTGNITVAADIIVGRRVRVWHGRTSGIGNMNARPEEMARSV